MPFYWGGDRLHSTTSTVVCPVPGLSSVVPWSPDLLAMAQRGLPVKYQNAAMEVCADTNEVVPARLYVLSCHTLCGALPQGDGQLSGPVTAGADAAPVWASAFHLKSGERKKSTCLSGLL